MLCWFTSVLIKQIIRCDVNDNTGLSHLIHSPPSRTMTRKVNGFLLPETTQTKNGASKIY